ncbi:MAG: DUF3299 domain-containing protein [Deltaproteobacteria bacterium]|jgi:hypothetical protein|nr:DUF3299 domain-containing protein [Deltaproteobacteria bacterium]
MRREIVFITIILLLALPLVFQPAPIVPNESLGVKSRLFTPEALLAKDGTKARMLNDQDNVHQSSGQNQNLPTPPSPENEEPIMTKPVVGAGGYLENGWLIWEELMPAGWDPVAIFDDLKINDMEDDDPRIDLIIDEFLRRWNDSPTNPEVNSKRLKIPGFVVPLDFEQEKVDEFFLVPFFGACIHVPPPPPNQIILVRLKKPIEGLGVMEVVWVYGKISVEKVTTDIGNSGYSLAADKVEFYNLDEETG